MALYIITTLGALAQYAETLGMNIAGCIILMFAALMLKAQRLTAQGTIYSSHVAWMSRTMSIASYFLFPISIAVILYCVFKYTDLQAPRRALEASGGKYMAVMLVIVINYIAHNESTIDSIVTWSLTPPILWWVRRCWYGYMRAKQSEPIDFPDSII